MSRGSLGGRRPRASAWWGAALLACWLVVLSAPAADAHTRLVDLRPASGERVTGRAPVTVTLTFSDLIDPDLANVVVVDAAGSPLPGATAVDGATVTHVTNDLPSPGAYTVRYRVVSADGHPVDGESRFDVAAPAPTRKPSPDRKEPQAGATPDRPNPATRPAAPLPSGSGAGRDDTGARTAVAAGAAALAALLVGAVVLARRRKDPDADASGTPGARS